MSKPLTGYQLSRRWFDFCFENPELITPTHTAIFCFAVDLCNRLGWKEKFGLPTTMTMEALGIAKHHTYTKYFNDLVAWGAITLVEKSRNQYSSNVISLHNAMPKKGEALAKAIDTYTEQKGLAPCRKTARHTETVPCQKTADHAAEQGHSTRQSGGSINKLQTTNLKPQTKSGENSPQPAQKKAAKSLEERRAEFYNNVAEYVEKYGKEICRAFYEYWSETNDGGQKMRKEMQPTFNTGGRLATWAKKEQIYKTQNNGQRKTNHQERTERADSVADIVNAANSILQAAIDNDNP